MQENQQEILARSQEQQILEQIAKIQATGKRVVIIVGEREQINNLVEKIAGEAEVVSPPELAGKLFTVEMSVKEPLKERIPPRDREYWRPRFNRTFRR